MKISILSFSEQNKLKNTNYENVQIFNITTHNTFIFPVQREHREDKAQPALKLTFGRRKLVEENWLQGHNLLQFHEDLNPQNRKHSKIS